MSRRYVLVAVALPVLAIGLGIVRAELFVRQARAFVFEIAGYDPRDLLRGHYLQFRLRVDPLPEREPCPEDAGEPCCLCLTRGEDDAVPSLAELARCDTARTSCDGALRTSALTRAYRYYVPEQRAADLERRLQDAALRRTAQAVVAVDAAGDAHVLALRLDGEPIPGGVTR